MSINLISKNVNNQVNNTTKTVDINNNDMESTIQYLIEQVTL